MLTAFAKERLMEVANIIIEEPKRLDMGSWVISMVELLPENRPVCNTVACIAGWVVALSLPSPCELIGIVDWQICDRAQKLLDLTQAEVNRLFFEDGFPLKFRLWDVKAGTEAYARRVHDRILFFIDSDGWDL